MITIYHKKGCTTSTKVLRLLEQSGKKFKVILYLETPLDFKDLNDLKSKLQVPAMSMLRKKEKLFKEKFSGKNKSEDEWLKVIEENPILLERPILTKVKNGIIARPAERALNFI